MSSMINAHSFEGAERENDDADTRPSLGARIQGVEDPSISSENEESIMNIEDNPDTQLPVTDEETPTSEDVEEATDAMNSDEEPNDDEEEATDAIENTQESQPPTAEAGDGQMSVFGRSQATADLPVAYEVESTEPPLPPTAQVRRMDSGDPTIPHAVPHDPVQEARIHHRRDMMKSAAMYLVGAALVGIILGSSLGRTASSGNSGEGDEPIEPTPSPTTEDFFQLQKLITSVSFDNGTSLKDTNSPQYKAFKWLERNEDLNEYEDWRRVQRYALATFYYAVNGENWFTNNGWLSDDDECTWYSQARDETTETGSSPVEVCDEDGTYAVMRLEKIGMNGTLPPELALLSDSLYRLDLELNLLNGTIPTELGLLTNLERLDLKKNRFTGTIPTELAMIGENYVSESGIFVNVGGNLLTGTIPTEILSMQGLGHLGLYECLLTGSIPTEVGLATDLVQLGLYRNELTCSLPTELGQLSLLERLLVYQNGQLNGTIPSEIGLLTNLEYFEPSANMLSGTIPSEVGMLTNLLTFRFDDNALKGTLPPEIGNMSNLVHLYLRINNLSGTIPSEVGLMSSLEQMPLYENNLTGVIPTEIGLCQELNYVDLASNSLDGTFPIELTRLPKLVQLLLYENEFTGSLPTEIGLLTNLALFYMINNNWSGTIPSEVGLMTGSKCFC